MGDRIADEKRDALLALLDERPAILGERAGKTLWSTIASEISLRSGSPACGPVCDERPCAGSDLAIPGRARLLPADIVFERCLARANRRCAAAPARIVHAVPSLSVA
jgi:hypothetical protein